MAVINPAFTVTITLRRPTTEDFGEESFTTLPPVQAVLSLSPPIHAGPGLAVTSRFTVSGTVFVPRGSDVASNDTFVYKGHTFRVTGWPRGDQQQAFTGDDFGWVSYLIEAAA